MNEIYKDQKKCSIPGWSFFLVSFYVIFSQHIFSLFYFDLRAHIEIEESKLDDLGSLWGSQL